jgi:ketosteroid isomerase-like protein
MFGWIVGLMIRRGVRHLNAGYVGPMLSSYSRNAVLVFPGDHSWGGEYHGKDRIEEFLRRCVSAGLKFEIEDIVVGGWPWSANVCIRLTDSAAAPDGTVIYSNRALIFAKIAWGKIKFQEDYEDTQKVVGLDEYLATHESAVA